MPAKVTLYGIKNCDTMKKARDWLDARGVAYVFHDYKTAGAPRAAVEAWVEALGWEGVLNRSGQTFRNLPDASKQNLDARKAVALMLANPSAIKRPLLDKGGKFTAGFKPEVYEALFAAKR